MKLSLRPARRRGLDRTLGALLLMAAAALLSACGSSSNSQTVGSITQAPTLETIAVDPPDPSLPLGLTTQLTATGVYSDGSQQDLSRQVIWSSSNANIASVSLDPAAYGLITAVSTGTVTIKAVLGTVTGTATLTVTPAVLEFIAVTPTQSTIARGQQLQFAATGIYSDNSTQVLTTTATWGSSATTVATVGNAPGTFGLATGVNNGTTTITAVFGELSGSTTLTVGAPAVTLVALTVTPANASTAKGTTLQYAATGTYSDGSMQNVTATVTWTSSAPATATINAAGLASAVTVGATAITATLNGISSSTGLNVTAATLVSIAVTPPNPSIANRQTQAFVATGTYSDQTTQNLTTVANWNSTTPTVATISNAAPDQGIATAVSVGTTQITAADGGIISPAVTLTVTVPPQFAYATNFGVRPASQTNPGTISSFSVGADGALTAIGTPVATDDGPFVSAIDPRSQYLYVVNYFSSTVSQYGIAANGLLTPIAASVPTGGGANEGPNGLTVDPVGRNLYVANYNDGTVSQYTIGANGALTPLVPVTVNAGGGAAAVAVDPTDRYVYVANYDVGTLSQYTVTNPTGALTPIAGTVATGANPNCVIVEPQGRFVFTANANAGQPAGSLSQYSIGAGGALTPLAAPTVAAGGGSSYIAVDTTGSFAYVVNSTDSTVSEYTIGAAGLAPLGTVPIPGGGMGPNYVYVDKTNQFVYVADRTSGDVAQFTKNADGTLTPLAVPTIPSGTGTTSVVVTY